MDIFDNINRLASYALAAGLIEEEDVVFAKNRLLMELGLDGFDGMEKAVELPLVEKGDLEAILSEILQRL